MSVPEQVPYKEYRATGSNNSFEITFYLPDPKDLVVMVNKEIPLVGAYSIVGDSVVFSTPPNEGDLVEIIRDTQLDRETNFKSYDNSFRPETINFDLDKIWLVLQESNLVDAKILARLKQEIEWRRTHDFNYDELAQVREKQQFDALKNYSEMLLASTNPGVFQGVIAGVVFARDGKSIQTHLEEILENLVASREDIDSKANQNYVDEQLNLKAPLSKTNQLQEEKADLDYVNSIVSAASEGTIPFQTEVELLLSRPIQAKVLAKALDTRHEFLWTRTSAEGVTPVTGNWVDTGLSELDQAKASSIQKDSAFYIYSATNLINNGVGSKNKKMEGMIYGDMKWAKKGTSYSKIIPVVAGVEIYIRSDKDSWWNYGLGFACGFFNQLPVFGNTVIPVNWAATLITRNGVRYSKLNVPTDAKYLVLNEFFAETPEQGSAKWFVSYKEFVDTFEASEQSFLASVNYEQIKALSVFEDELTSKSLLVQKSGMVYDKSIYRSGYITPTKTIGPNTGPDWRLAVVEAQSGREYFAKIDKTAFPSNIACYNATVDEFMRLPVDSQLLDAKIEAYDSVNSIYKIIFDEKFKGGTLLITTKVDEWGAYTFNIVDSLKVWTDEPSSLDISRDEIDKIDGKPLADSFARKLAVEASSKTQLQSNFFKNIGVGSNIFLFGDSISTENYSGGYYRFIESTLSAKVTSYASNAANTNRMYGVVLGKRSRNGYDEDTPYPQKDFSICDIALIAIGTNDAAKGDDFWDTLDSIPAGSVFDHIADDTVDDYFESFPATFFGNVGACIEYIKWKNPKTRIYLLSQLNANGKDRRTLVKYYSELAAYYSIPLINATEDSGLDLKNISIWTNDNLHPNEVGNEIFGNFIARKIISM